MMPIKVSMQTPTDTWRDDMYYLKVLIIYVDELKEKTEK